VEIGASESDDELRRLKAIADATGMEIPSIMGGPHWQFPLSDPDPKVRKKCADSFQHALETAHLVGADTVLLVPGVVNENVTYEEAYARSQAEIRELAKVAEASQVYLGLENVWNKFLLSPLEFVQFIDEIGSPYVQAYFDCGNILTYGYPQHWIRTLGARIKKVTYLLHGHVTWAEVRKALADVGYDDYLTVELPPYPQAPELMVYDSARQLDRIIEGV